MSILAGKDRTSNGFGFMRYTIPTAPVPDSIAFPIMKAAIDAGATIWSGATFYGTPSANSLHLFARYFAAHPADASKVTLCIKGCVVNISTMDCSPVAVRREVEACNFILAGTKSLDFFGPARVDPNTPIEETVAELGELVKEGKIKGILLSEVSAATIKKAQEVHHITVVEAELSLWATEILHNGVAKACQDLSIVVLGYSPLGRGVLAGNFDTHEDVAKGEFHSMFPRFQGDNFEQNIKLVKELRKLASSKGCTNAQFALAWLRHLNGKPEFPIIVPLPGARSEERLMENCVDVVLTDVEAEEVKALLVKFPIVGGRYPAVASGLLEY